MLMTKNTQNLFAIGCLLSLLLWACGTTANSVGSPLPAEVPINKEAGRGGCLFVTLRLESGKEAAFIVDTGTTGTLLDKSLEPTLGTPRGQTTMNAWGKKKVLNVYAAPKLYLGNVQLLTGSNVVSWDFGEAGSGAGPKPLGLLGFDCLKHYCIQLDFGEGKMRFLNSGLLQTAIPGKGFPITVSRGGRPFIYGANLAGVPSTNALTDPGFLARRDGLPGTYALIDTGFPADGRIGKGAIKGHDSGRLILTASVWEGGNYTNLIVGIEEQANLLGLRFLARHLVTLDFPNQTLYLKQTRVGPLE